MSPVQAREFPVQAREFPVQAREFLARAREFPVQALEFRLANTDTEGRTTPAGTHHGHHPLRRTRHRYEATVHPAALNQWL
ncbi:hypothetical protein Atai01_14680 [Amycolatopsis taiwanensis]|uniref:Uncharacterized protein n=1 Tax=Amycolatopsis taiwanensis TaxID=342230 RepID=A0A9W6QVF3_9PSEU|nr:hypothetical protein Atai01_14680 [Amycolatopsis taiwanensis]